jgi:hypothetical protein
MNTEKLAKLYDQLMPQERVALLLAALADGDEVERKRLHDSAPQGRWQGPDHIPLVVCLSYAADLQMMSLLDLANWFWRFWGLFASHLRLAAATAEHPPKRSAKPRGKAKTRARAAFRAANGNSPDGPRGSAAEEMPAEVRLHGITRYHATRFIACLDGWEKYCAEIQFPSHLLLARLPGWDTVRQTEAATRDMVFTPEEAAGFLLVESRSDLNDSRTLSCPEPILFADAIAEVWHQILDQHRAEWATGAKKP